ncbi:MAG: hypothetical protein GXO49_04035 [Chlorobi bacterium]|nr:hypothetical protein [Chlorobiota bacterium]
MTQTNTTIKEPIFFLIEKYGFDINSIKEIIFGNTYVAVLLKNGNLGVSANLINFNSFNFEELKSIDINKNSHRNILNAYFNAVLNTKQQNLQKTDIFDFVNFSKYKNLVMIGFSEPMYKKLKKHNIEIAIFDLYSKENFIKDLSIQKECLHKADCVILTATTLANNTFFEITENTNKCDIFMFGASTIMHEDMFHYKNIKGLFGTVFNKNDQKLIEIIKEGHGQRFTKNHGYKAALIK